MTCVAVSERATSFNEVCKLHIARPGPHTFNLASSVCNKLLQPSMPPDPTTTTNPVRACASRTPFQPPPLLLSIHTAAKPSMRDNAQHLPKLQPRLCQYLPTCPSCSKLSGSSRVCAFLSTKGSRPACKLPPAGIPPALPTAYTQHLCGSEIGSTSSLL